MLTLTLTLTRHIRQKTANPRDAIRERAIRRLSSMQVRSEQNAALAAHESDWRCRDESASVLSGPSQSAAAKAATLCLDVQDSILWIYYNTYIVRVVVHEEIIVETRPPPFCPGSSSLLFSPLFLLFLLFLLIPPLLAAVLLPLP